MHILDPAHCLGEGDMAVEAEVGHANQRRSFDSFATMHIDGQLTAHRSVNHQGSLHQSLGRKRLAIAAIRQRHIPLTEPLLKLGSQSAFLGVTETQDHPNLLLYQDLNIYSLGCPSQRQSPWNHPVNLKRCHSDGSGDP
jgi:hypothetical protein